MEQIIEFIIKSNRFEENEFSCCVCLNFILEPWVSNKCGHTVCEECRKQLTRCPYCKANNIQFVRNYFLENMIKKLLYRCDCGKLSNIALNHPQECSLFCKGCLEYKCDKKCLGFTFFSKIEEWLNKVTQIKQENKEEFDFLFEYIIIIKKLIDKKPIRNIATCNPLVFHFIKDPLIWNEISSIKDLPESFLRNFKHDIIWSKVDYYSVSEQLVIDLHYKVDWQKVSKYVKLSRATVKKFSGSIIWNVMLNSIPDLDNDIFRDNLDKIDNYWNILAKKQNLTMDFIEEFHHKFVDKRILIASQTIDFGFVDKHYTTRELVEYVLIFFEDIPKSYILKNYKTILELDHLKKSQIEIIRHLDAIVEMDPEIQNKLLDWKDLTVPGDVSIDFVRKFCYKIDWEYFTGNCEYITDEFIIEFDRYIHWETLVISHKLSERIIIEYFERIDNEYLVTHQTLPMEVIYALFENYDEEIVRLYKYQDLDLEFILNNIEKLSPSVLGSNEKNLKKLTIENISEVGYSKRYDLFSRYFSLTEEYITRNVNLLNWGDLSRYQKLSENMIIRYKDLVNWNNISRYQELSEDFIIKNSDKVCLSILVKNKLTPSLKRTICHLTGGTYFNRIN